MILIKRIFGGVAILTGVAALGALLAGVSFGVTFAVAGWRWLMNEVDLDVVNVDVGDPRVLEASRRARETLPQFWKYLEQGRYECYVKFPMQMRSGHVEHVWGVVHSRKADEVLVSVVNTPLEDPLQPDGRMRVATSQIEDWQVIIGPNEIRGGYSVGALAEVARSRGFRLGRKSRQALSAFRDQRVQP